MIPAALGVAVGAVAWRHSSRVTYGRADARV